MMFSSRKNTEAFDKETRNDNIDITDVDANADLFGKCSMNIDENDMYPSDLVRQSFYGEILLLSVASWDFLTNLFRTD